MVQLPFKMNTQSTFLIEVNSTHIDTADKEGDAFRNKVKQTIYLMRLQSLFSSIQSSLQLPNWLSLSLFLFFSLSLSTPGATLCFSSVIFNQPVQFHPNQN